MVCLLLVITEVFIPLGPLRDCCCFCPPLVPAGGSGCHSRSWRSCHPWAQRRAVPAASPCAFACLGWPWPLQLAPCGCSGAAARGWTAATGPAHTARFVLGILGKTRVKKEKERLLHSQKEKEGEHDSKDKAPFKPASKHCLLLVLKVEMRNSARLWAAGGDSPPWLRDGFQTLFWVFLLGSQEPVGRWAGVWGDLPPSVLRCLQGREGMQMEKSHARLKPLELCNPSLCLLGHLVWLPSVTVACPTRFISCQVCGQPLSGWPQICKAQREGRNCREQQLENFFPSARALLTLSMHIHAAEDLGEAGWEQS